MRIFSWLSPNEAGEGGPETIRGVPPTQNQTMRPAPKPFLPLKHHTESSLLGGASRIPALVARAAELEMPALAMTDHGVMYGAIHFYKACKEAGIKPIAGCEACDA